MKHILKITALLAPLMAGSAFAQEAVTAQVGATYTCSYVDGPEVVVVNTTRYRRLLNVAYLRGSLAGDIMVESHYTGYWVLGISGRHSPMLNFRLEVRRLESGGPLVGVMWEQGASSASEVECIYERLVTD